MKKLYIRFTVTLLLLMLAATSVASGLSFVISNYLLPASSDYNIFAELRIRGLLTPLLTILGYAIFIPIISKKTAAPIVALSKATHQIANDDFDIQVNVSRRKDEIGELERNFNLMAKELKSNEFMKKDFIANVSHEFKTPLAIIKGYGKLLADDGLTSGERRQYAHLIEHESERLITLTTNILRLSKLDNQAIQPAVASFSLDEQIRQAMLALQPKWSGKNIAFDIDLQALNFEGDEELMSQVWLNLLNNSIKFSNDNGVISVAMHNTSDNVQIVVSDDGIGMNADERARIFDQFYQSDTSLAKEGSGLGLTIVKRIVDMHHGGIEVKSEPGEGTRFIVSLPI